MLRLMWERGRVTSPRVISMGSLASLAAFSVRKTSLDCAGLRWRGSRILVCVVERRALRSGVEAGRNTGRVPVDWC